MRLATGAATMLAAATLLGGVPVRADVVTPDNTIIGVFSDPILAGNIINDPVVGRTSYHDYSATAVATGVGTGTLTWGTGVSPPPTNASFLTFTGSTMLPSSALNPIAIGKITYYNGTSDLDSLIFGATLAFYLNTVSPATLLGSDTVYINTVTNQYSGTGLTSAQLQTDADYVNICGSSSNICGQSIESYESTEVTGYQPLLVDLDAIYQGDPSITLTDAVIDPNDPGDGIVGGEPAASVPEPGSLLLLGTVVLGFAGFARRRRGR